MGKPSPLRETRGGPVVGWVRSVNGLVRSAVDAPAGRRAADVLSANEAGAAASIRFSGSAAEAAVRHGLKPQALAGLAGAAGVDVQELYEFAGIDRTTVARRAQRGEPLPQEAAVKALEFADLASTAVDVFGDVPAAATWLTRPHPLLDDDTPLQRARTPWGLQRVRALLGALKHGGVA